MLTQAFLKTLSARAQQIRPVVLIGNKGLTDTVHQEIDVALTAHELIKIRVNASSKDIRTQMITEIASKHEATVVQAIGHVVAIYRVNPDKH
jgi:RNA-binding protein